MSTANKPSEKINRKTQIRYKKNQQLVVLRLRDARLEVDFRDVSPSLPSLPASPSRHSASQSRWVRRPRCSPPLSNIIGHIPGLALVENKDSPCWAHTNWTVYSKGLKKERKVEVTLGHGYDKMLLCRKRKSWFTVEKYIINPDIDSEFEFVTPDFETIKFNCS